VLIGPQTDSKMACTLQPGGASNTQQFFAVVWKNFLLRTSSSSGFCGLPRTLLGWVGLLVEVLLPVAFFLIMCVPHYYIRPTPLPAQFFPKSSLDSLDWTMAYYKGPGASSPTGATVLFAPNSTEELSLMTAVAQSLSCGSLHSSPPLTEPDFTQTVGSNSYREDLSVFIQTFSDMFPIANRSAECTTRAECLSSPQCYEPLIGRQLVGFQSEEEAVAHAMRNPQTVDGVVVVRSGAGTSEVSYDIRLNHTLVPDTRARLNKYEIQPGYEYRKYWFFANLQQHLDRAIIGLASGTGSSNGTHYPAEVTLALKAYPWPAKVINFAAFVSGGFFKLLMVLAFLPQVKASVVAVVQEKELRLREGMKTLGLHDAAYWASWTITHFSTLYLSGIGCAVVGTYAFPHTELSVMLMFYALSALALITFSYFLSTLFSKQRVAGFAAVMIFCAAMLPGYLMPTLVQPYGGSGWTLSCLLPPSAITLFVECILSVETVERGVTWETLDVSAAVEYDFSPATVFNMLIIDVIVYALLTWYCDQVLPGEWGQRQKWYFPLLWLLPSYWKSALGIRPANAADGEEEAGGSLEAPLLGHSNWQGTSPVAVSISGLTKSFHTSDGIEKLAVNDLSLDIYKGQITALLGHNGAGKTTTISILTGMLQATSGSATVNGLRIDRDMPRIRSSLGLCPQFDILWPTITVKDHLLLYSRIKGVPSGRAMQAVVSAANEVGLSDKLDTPAGELSGGQARKLSVAIAFMGSPAVVFLDEPTSTMDPYSRRFTWDIIRRNRKDCAVILTTHSMEEADILSDRIAIMADGHLAALGSSLELKSAYGAGYTLVMLTAQGGQPGCHATGKKVFDFVRQHVPGALMSGFVGAEIAVRLPGAESPMFAGLLRELESKKAELGVSSYSLGVTTLEEVFIRVTEGTVEIPSKSASAPPRDGHSAADPPSDEQQGGSGTPLLPVSTLPMEPTDSHASLSGLPLYWQQLRSLFLKRAICARRDFGASMVQLLVPLLLVAVALYARTSTVRIDQLPPAAMTRKHAAFGLPAGLAIAPEAAANAASVAAFEAAYYRSRLLDSGTSAIQSWFTPRPVNETLDGWLINNWYVSKNHTYDALFLETLPDGIATGETVDGTVLTLLVNETAYHALPTAVNQVSNALLRAVAGKQAKISVRSHPLPALPTELSQQIETSAGNLLLVLLIMLAMAGMSASFSVFLVREAESGSKLVQLVAGAPRSAFWLAHWAFDLLTTGILLAATLAGFYLCGLPEFQGNRLAAIAVALLLFGLASVPLTYCLHFLYNDEMHALQSINTLLTCVGTLGFLVVWILSAVYSFFHSPRVHMFLTVSKTALRVTSPHYCLGQCIYHMADDYYQAQKYGSDPNPWAPEVCGRYLLWMALQAVVYPLITLAAEGIAGRQASILASLRCGSTRYDCGLEEPMDPDVAEEQRCARAALHENDPSVKMVMAGVHKLYPTGLLKPPTRALRGVWLALRRGECLGVLGVSGAGKTTSFRIASGEVAPSAGDLLVCGKSVTHELAAVRRNLGYCPQDDPLLPLMTASELLAMFAHLRGVPASRVAALVEAMIARLGLTEYAHRCCGTYSGGNKRKLSVSAALIGQPQVLLLDEPSAGIDPGARRFLWEYMSKEVLQGGRSVLLTSHSMEECEVLCSRIAVLSAGQLQCIGTAQHLKSRFADGYSLELRLGEHQDTEAASQFFSRLAEMGEVVESEPGRQLLRLPATGLDLPSLFEDIEASRAAAGVVDYSLSQTSLEQVFLQLAHASTQDGGSSCQ